MVRNTHNIAVFGGSFSPPHLGHAMVVQHILLNEPQIDSLLVIPCLAQSGKDLLSWAHRYEMCRLVFEPISSLVEVNGIEQELGGISYSIRALQELSRRYPGDKFSLVIGSDFKDKIKTWKDGACIERDYSLLVVNRSDSTISSTLIRSKLKESQSVERYLSRSVLKYIKQNNLYA